VRDVLTDLVIDLVGYPVRNAHPLVAFAYWAVLAAMALAVCFAIATLFPRPTA